MAHRLDTMISKGAGKVKGVKARLEGLVGVFNTLAEQHTEMKVLLRRLQAAPDRRSELWPEIRRELLSHERAEVREVFSMLRDRAETRAFAEHHDLERTPALTSADPDACLYELRPGALGSPSSPLGTPRSPSQGG